MARADLLDLGLSIPLVAAPMAGGPTTPELVIAAARSGGIGFLAGGYKTADALAAQITAVSAVTTTFGVNLFAPNPVPVDPIEYARYRDAIEADAERFGAPRPEEPIEDDDGWRDKIDVLLANPVPIVSFTFGVPEPAVLTGLRKAGSIVVQTVTSAVEAVRAAEAGVDVLAVQASSAGGHSGTLTPDHRPSATPLTALLAEIEHAVELPMIAAGGLATPTDVAAAIGAGARAAMVGTALLLAPEAGTSAPHRRALRDPTRGDTVVTRAFTGRPARALRNRFVDAHDAHAPAGYPAVHHLTSPTRRAAAAAADEEYLNLWAGAGYRLAAEAPAEQILRTLADAV